MKKTVINNDIESIYIHIPFCKNICSYCDFCKNFYNEDISYKYIEKLTDEFNNNYKNELIKTVYIGGGTPSSLSYNNLCKLFSITNKINLDSLYEFSFECNYEDITEDLLILLKKNRVNRISIGIQSFNKKFKKILNRSINKEKMIDSIYLCKKYFDNINIDLMYAIKNQTISDLINDLNIASKLPITHISIYSLILEDNTILKIKKFKEVDDSFQNKMYYTIVNNLQKKGFIQYEISNFSKKSFESKHNLTYWNNKNYYGFGAGASGFINNIRYDNVKSIYKYINGKTRMYEEKIDENRLLDDEIMLGLRKINGINKKEFFNKFNIDIKSLNNIEFLINEKVLIDDDNNLFISHKYLFVSNEIIIKILE